MQNILLLMEHGLEINEDKMGKEDTTQQDSIKSHTGQKTPEKNGPEGIYVLFLWLCLNFTILFYLHHLMSWLWASVLFVM